MIAPRQNILIVYIACLALACDRGHTESELSVTNPLKGSDTDVHLMLFESADPTVSTDSADAPRWEPRPIESSVPFNELLPSWNVDVPQGCGFTIEVRVGRKKDNLWSAYYYFGRWGDAPLPERRILKDDLGRVDVDVFRSEQEFDRLQFRLTRYPESRSDAIHIKRLAACVSNTLHDAQWKARHQPAEPSLPTQDRWARRLTVPFKSQRDADDAIAGEICSPTSTSMVMAYHGVDQPTEALARLIYDDDYAIYGNWSRAVQAAHTHTVPGYLRRFNSWDDVKRCIAADQPIIASIKASEGELRGAPYASSAGHLLVIVGFDEAGNVHVNDPAAQTTETGRVTYQRKDMEAVWLSHGGVGYILEPSPKPTPAE